MFERGTRGYLIGSCVNAGSGLLLGYLDTNLGFHHDGKEYVYSIGTDTSSTPFPMYLVVMIWISLR